VFLTGGRLSFRPIRRLFDQRFGSDRIASGDQSSRSHPARPDRPIRELADWTVKAA